MSFTSLVILYLSIGAPFAAHLVASRPRRPMLGRLLQGFVALLIWPILAIRFVIRKTFCLIGMKSGEAGRPAAVKDTFKTLERATEGKVSADVSKAIVFLVEKYLVLTSESFEAARGLTAPFLSPVFEVGGHSKPEIGSTCLARRNRRIIETHRLSALESLAKLLKESVSDGVRIDINSALRTLIESFRDEAGLEVLNSFETESKHLAITRPAVSTVLRAESA